MTKSVIYQMFKQRRNRTAHHVVRRVDAFVHYAVTRQLNSLLVFGRRRVGRRTLLHVWNRIRTSV